MRDATSTLALFDFDHTILSADSSGEFIRFAFQQSANRQRMLKMATPLFKMLSVSPRTEWRRNWLYYQFAVGGKSHKRMENLKHDFYHHLFKHKRVGAYVSAMDKIWEHQKSGHDVVVISGSLQWLLEELCERLNIRDVTIYGSRKDWFCYGPNKVITLQDNINLTNYQEIHGYSDSAADIPMLRLCTHKTVVNPKAECARKFEQVFGNEHQVVSWETQAHQSNAKQSGDHKAKSQYDHEPANQNE